MIIGIMGGMGPAATCDLFRKITEFTHAAKDQEHIHVVIDSNVQIPDRTQYILRGGEDPRIEMVRSAIRLEMMGAEYIAIPCNTAHYFYDDVAKYTRAKLLHMIRETAEFLANEYPGHKDFLLLATEGVYAAGVYRKVFADYGLNTIEPGDDDKKTVMDWIYKIKAGCYDISPAEYENLIKKYLINEKTPVILGCTELPLLAERMSAPIVYVDPTSILAKRCVEIAESSK